MKRFALCLLLASPAFAQSDKLTLNFDYPPAALDPALPIVFRVYHSPLITVHLTNWPVIALSTNSTNFLIPKVPGFNHIAATASNALNLSAFSPVKSYFVPIPPGQPRIGVPPGTYAAPMPSEGLITSGLQLIPEMPSGARIVVSPNHAAGRDWPQETNPNDFTTTFYSKDGIMWKASWSTGQEVSPNQNDGNPKQNRRKLEK